MINDPNRMYTVGELARWCGVTVRTLQYYDKEGILSPQHFTEGGRRLYSKDDLMSLQQIIFFKSFGFSLDEIRDRLMKNVSSEQISRMFTQQKQVLEQQADKLREVIDLLSALVEETECMGSLNTEKLMLLMELMKERSPYSFVLRYFGEKEMEIIKGIAIGDESGYADEWQALFSQLLELYQRGADPEGSEGQALAERWWDSVQRFTRGDQDVMNTLVSIGGDVENWPEQTGDVKEATQTFLSKALGKYLMSNGLMPEGSKINE